jgi:alpha-amylase
MYFRETSADDGRTFDLPAGQPCTLAFSRLLARREVLFAYNTSTTEGRREAVVVDASLHPEGARFECLYGGHGDVVAERSPDPSNGTRFVMLDLAPMQLVVLRRLG